MMVCDKQDPANRGRISKTREEVLRRYNHSCMSPSRRWTIAILVSSAILGYVIPPAFAQIIELRNYRGKQIQCIRSGITGFGRPCGIDGNYAYVFIGSVVSTIKVSDTETRLMVAPEEVFLGADATALMITTSQGGCLPDIVPGARWLFYLQRDRKTNALLLAYGSPSKPIAEAEKEITLLRRLAHLSDAGLIAGNVRRQVWNDADKFETFVSVPNQKLVAKRISDGTEYDAFTDSNGHYEFESLPPGSYRVSANTTQGLWVEDGGAQVHSGSCSDIGFKLLPDGRISGHIRAADGKPAANMQVFVVPLSSSDLEFTSATADAYGYFEVKGLHPGRYLVGTGIYDLPGVRDGNLHIYYPGVQSRDLAVVIELGQAEKHTNVDFQLLNSTLP